MHDFDPELDTDCSACFHTPCPTNCSGDSSQRRGKTDSLEQYELHSLTLRKQTNTHLSTIKSFTRGVCCWPRPPDKWSPTGGHLRILCGRADKDQRKKRTTLSINKGKVIPPSALVPGPAPSKDSSPLNQLACWFLVCCLSHHPSEVGCVSKIYSTLH